MRDFFIQHDAAIKLLLVIGVFASFGLAVFNLVQVPEIEQGKLEKQTIQLIEKSVQCGEECERKINEIVARAIATLSATPSKTTTSTTSPAGLSTSTTQVSYVPIGGSGTTTNTDWVSLTNTDLFFDIGEYGKVKSSRWSANLKLKHATGQAFARLFDVTHGVVVPGSEISTKNATYTLIESGELLFLSGKNVYRVQIKSLDSTEVTFDSGRIKITGE